MSLTRYAGIRTCYEKPTFPSSKWRYRRNQYDATHRYGVYSADFFYCHGVDVNRPSAQTAVEKERANILIAIRENDEIWIDNRQIDRRAVRAIVERLHAENPEGAVIILADENAKTGILIEVMDQARLAGVANVSIAAERD